MPYASITISTRERAGFRDNIIGIAATKISAGVDVGIGGHSGEDKGDEQFEISDGRSVDEVYNAICRARSPACNGRLSVRIKLRIVHKPRIFLPHFAFGETGRTGAPQCAA